MLPLLMSNIIHTPTEREKSPWLFEQLEDYITKIPKVEIACISFLLGAMIKIMFII